MVNRLQIRRVVMFYLSEFMETIFIQIYPSEQDDIIVMEHIFRPVDINLNSYYAHPVQVPPLSYENRYDAPLFKYAICRT